MRVCAFFLWLLTDVHAGTLQVAEVGLLLPACCADVGPGVLSPPDLWSMPAPPCSVPLGMLPGTSCLSCSGAVAPCLVRMSGQ